MAENRNPIQVELIAKDEYEVSITINGWKVSKRINSRALKELKQRIEDVSGLTKITEVFSCNGEDEL